MGDTTPATKDENKDIQSREETRASERYIKPAINIIESEAALTLVADIPGAVKDSVDINVDKGILTINAPVSRTMPGQLIYAEFEFAHYYRQFSIPETLDHEKAQAEFNNGVLTLKIPVSESAKPRKIEVKAG